MRKITLAALSIVVLAATADYSYVLGYKHGHSAPLTVTAGDSWTAITQRAQVINQCYDTTSTKDDLYNCYVNN